jgi:hypothetical protein
VLLAGCATIFSTEMLKWYVCCPSLEMSVSQVRAGFSHIPFKLGHYKASLCFPLKKKAAEFWQKWKCRSAEMRGGGGGGVPNNTKKKNKNNP